MRVCGIVPGSTKRKGPLDSKRKWGIGCFPSRQAGSRSLPALEWWALGVCIWLGTSLTSLSMICISIAHIYQRMMWRTTVPSMRSASTGAGTGAAETVKAATKGLLLAMHIFPMVVFFWFLTSEESNEWEFHVLELVLGFAGSVVLQLLAMFEDCWDLMKMVRSLGVALYIRPYLSGMTRQGEGSKLEWKKLQILNPQCLIC